MSNIVKIANSDDCCLASAWCKRNIMHWTLSFEFGTRITYVFEFTDERDATWFALKWGS